MDHTSDIESNRLLLSPPGNTALWVASVIFVVATVMALSIDMSVAGYFRVVKLPGDLRRCVGFSEVFGHGLGVTLLILTAAILDRRGWRCFVILSFYAFGSGLLADVLKTLIARSRPYYVADLSVSVWDTFQGWLPILHGIDLRQGNTAFPSAHTATAVGLAIGLSRLYPRGRIMFSFFAMLTALQRITALAHFPSDTLGGAAAGCLWGATLSQPWSITTRMMRAGKSGNGESCEASLVAARKCA